MQTTLRDYSSRLFNLTIFTLYRLSFFFTNTATTEIYTLSLHDALPICNLQSSLNSVYSGRPVSATPVEPAQAAGFFSRSEEHTSELQSRRDLVCRLLLEKKKKKKTMTLLLYELHTNAWLHVYRSAP